jgi:hypothetical protein
MSIVSEPRWDDRAAFRFFRNGVLAAAVAATAPPIVAAVTGDARLTKPTIAIALLGICTGLAWITAAVAWHRIRGGRLLPVVIIAGVMVSFAGTIARHPERNWDYVVTYELPAQQLASGIDPYDGGETTNPPTWAQLTAATAALLRASVLRGAAPDVVWFWVFYIYQMLQLALLGVLFGLAYIVVRNAGRGPLAATLIAGTALVICAPLQETLQLNQLNLVVVVLTMTAVLWGEQYPLRAALAAGLGGAVKLYPFGVALLWLARRNVRPIVWTAIVALGIATSGWRGWALYARYLQEFQRPAIVRDASLHSLASNITAASADAAGFDAAAVATVSFALWIALDLALLAWLVWRQYTVRGPSWEIVAALPLLFPLAWVHHYLLVLPLGIARLSAPGSSSLTATTGALLALVLPAFDTFPLGLSRPLGTLLLLGTSNRERRSA